MAQVPVETTSNIQPAASPPNDYANLNSSPADFGGLIAQGTERVGQGLVQAGNTGLDIATMRAQRFNQIQVDDQFNKFQAAINKATYGDQSDPNAPPGLYSLKGSDALRAGPQAIQSLTDQREALRNSLPTQAAQLEFDQQSRRLLQFASGQIGQHLNQQADAYGVGVNQDRLKNAATAAFNTWNSDDAFGNAQAQARQTAVQLAQLKYGHNLDPAITQASIREADTSIVSARIDGWATRDPVGALGWLQNGTMLDWSGKRVPVSQAVDPAKYRELQQRLEPAARRIGNEAGGADAFGAAIGGGSAPAPSGPVPTMISTEAQRQGVDPTLALTAAKIESNMGTLPDRAGSQYQGVFQLGDTERAANGATAAYGTDKGEQVRLGVSQLAKVQSEAAAALGRDPAPWEVYMAHQQGVGGLVAYQQDPNRSAIDAMLSTREGQQKGRAWATQAVLGNIPSDQRAALGNNPTSGQFLSMWQQKYAAAQRSVGGAAAVADGGMQTPDGSPITSASARPGTAAAAGIPDTMPFPDDEKAWARIQQQTNDPADQAARLSNYNRQKSQYIIGIKGAQTRMTAQVGDTIAALQDGRDVDPPAESAIRHLYPAAQADAIVEKLNEAQDFSVIRRAVDLAGPQELASMRDQLASNTGLLPTMLRLRRGQIADPNAPQAPTDVSAGSITSQTAGPDGGGPVAPGYRNQSRLQHMFEKAVVDRDRDLAADPAGFVAQRSPQVAAALLAATNGHGTPEAYAQATLAEQGRLGVADDKQSVLPKPQASALVHQIVSADPAETDAAKALDGMGQKYGQAWPHVFGDLVRAGLPPSYQTLAIMTEPGQAAARVGLQRALQYTAEKGGVEKLRDLVPGKGAGGGAQTIDQGLDDALSDFRSTTSLNGTAGQQLFSNVKDSVKLLAYWNASHGQDPAAALSSAVDGILGQKYDMDGSTFRAPKNQMSDVRAAITATVAGLKGADLAPIRGNPAITQDQRQGTLLDTIRREGVWTNNHDDSGVQLSVLGRDGLVYPVRRTDGSRVEIKFGALPTQQPWNSGALPPAQADDGSYQPSAPVGGGG